MKRAVEQRVWGSKMGRIESVKAGSRCPCVEGNLAKKLGVKE